MPRTCSVDLTLDLAAPHTARKLLCLLLPQWGIEDRGVIDDAALIVSELVTNAFVHGGRQGGSITVGAEAGPELVLWVVDTLPGVPTQRQAPVDAENGRGLEILSQLTTRWGVEETAGGKRVYASIPVDASRCA